MTSAESATRVDAQADIAGLRQKKEGTIEDLFTALTNPGPPLPQRFADLKKELFTYQLVESWREVLKELATTTEEVAVRGVDVRALLGLPTHTNFVLRRAQCIPQVDYPSIVNGLTKDQVEAVKHAGVVIVKGGVPPEVAVDPQSSCSRSCLS